VKLRELYKPPRPVIGKTQKSEKKDVKKLAVRKKTT